MSYLDEYREAYADDAGGVPEPTARRPRLAKGGPVGPPVHNHGYDPGCLEGYTSDGKLRGACLTGDVVRDITAGHPSDALRVTVLESRLREADDARLAAEGEAVKLSERVQELEAQLRKARERHVGLRHERARADRNVTRANLERDRLAAQLRSARDAAHVLTEALVKSERELTATRARVLQSEAPAARRYPLLNAGLVS